MYITNQKTYLTVIKNSHIDSFFVLYWYAYVHNDPVNLRDLWGLTASDSRKTVIVNVIGTVEGYEDDYLRQLEKNGTGNPLVTVTHADTAEELSAIFNSVGPNTDIILTSTHGYEFKAVIGTGTEDNDKGLFGSISASDLNVTASQNGNRLFLDMCYQGNYIKDWAEATTISQDNIFGNATTGLSGPSDVFLLEVIGGRNIDDAWSDYKTEINNYHTTGNYSAEFNEKFDEVRKWYFN